MDIIKLENVKDLLLEINNQQVLLDKDVASLYGVETKRVNEAVKNNPDRFPSGYIIEVDKDMKNELVENFDRFKTLKHSTSTPKAFTETTTKFEFNLGFAKVSRSIKKIKNEQK